MVAMVIVDSSRNREREKAIHPRAIRSQQITRKDRRRTKLRVTSTENKDESSPETNNSSVAYLLAIGSHTEINISKGPSAHSLGNAVFLIVAERRRRTIE
jgi:hypothetical protein